MKITKTDIKFEVNKIPHAFTVYQNLPETRGLSIEDALNSWVHRTKTYTVYSFCKYVMKKDPSIICIDEETFNRVKKLGT